MVNPDTAFHGVKGLMSIALAAAQLEAVDENHHNKANNHLTETLSHDQFNINMENPVLISPSPPRLTECHDTVIHKKNESVDEKDVSNVSSLIEQNKEVHAVNDNDVLCGRGGETNHHPGNVHYRSLVKKHQPAYLHAKRRDKPRIARLIVETVRKQNPPGRFLKKNSYTGTWREIGNSKAREKTSQALREGAQKIRDLYSSMASSDTNESNGLLTCNEKFNTEPGQVPTPGIAPLVPYTHVRQVSSASSSSDESNPTIPTYLPKNSTKRKFNETIIADPGTRENEDIYTVGRNILALSNVATQSLPLQKRASRGPRLRVLKARMIHAVESEKYLSTSPQIMSTI